jgi:hypothetical protein
VLGQSLSQGLAIRVAWFGTVSLSRSCPRPLQCAQVTASFRTIFSSTQKPDHGPCLVPCGKPNFGLVFCEAAN